VSSLPLPVQTFGLLVLSNVFMTIAWYGHLKDMASKPWWIALTERLHSSHDKHVTAV
jgi:uncharacterized protein